MKIAVCYRGYLRTLSKTFENQKEYLFQDHNVDFFCHTWNSYPEEIQYLKDVVKPKRLLVEETKCLERNPYSCMVIGESFESIKNFDKKRKISDGYLESIPYNVLSMMYSLNKVNCLRKEYSQSENIKYDAVITVRPDIYFYNQFRYNETDLYKINISWYENIGDHLNNPNAIIDHIAFSKEDHIDQYSDCFLYIPAYFFNHQIPFVHETLLGWHVKTVSDIDVNMINTRHKVIRIKNYNPYENLDK
tara:strand:- start:4431 stop:5171 length:741 start_codon:yes stop_codon:yes gene_type:complete